MTSAKPSLVMHPMASEAMAQRVEANFKDAMAALEQAIRNPSLHQSVALAAGAMAESLAQGGRIFSCGNGGSLCDAMHFAEELSGRYRQDRRALAAVSIADASHMSCVGNDYGYEFIFSRYLEAHGRPGDVLLAITTSGKSPNVLRAAKTAADGGMRVVAMTGVASSPLAEHADIEIITPGTSGFADRVQELHIKVIHTLIELIERTLFPENYA